MGLHNVFAGILDLSRRGGERYLSLIASHHAISRRLRSIAMELSKFFSKNAS